ncbi:MAG: hypothetical protein IAE91_13870 [Ignavibacteriaceae bacterium]|nr:hypothetical protein [Ignavibacteriaceae bacterium]
MVKIFLTILLLFPVLITPQDIKVKAYPDSTNYLIGDFININLEFEYKNGIEIFLPAIRDSIKSLEFLSDSTRKIEKDGIVNLKYIYTFAGFDSLDVLVPPLPVIYKRQGSNTLDTVYSAQFSIYVRTVAVDTSAEFKDIKKPETIPFDWLILIYILLIAFVLLIAGYFIYKKYKNRKPPVEIVPEVPKPSPYEIAISELKELESKNLWQNGLTKEYHSGITGIVRKYFEGRFTLPSLELTTSETLEHLKALRGAESILDITDEFLSNADMVKFAKYQPLPEINEVMMKQAYEIVEKTAKPNMKIQNGIKNELE